MTNLIIPIILSGGRGTRLWPLSTKEQPKQFIPLLSKHSLLQETIIRLESSTKNIALPIIVSNKKYSSLLNTQLKEINKAAQTIILEPIGRNTAPAIALAAIHALNINKDQDPVLLVLPADHAISDLKKFHTALDIAKEYAEKNKLVTFGVKPTRPETGYGYIKTASKIDGKQAYNIENFVEKPNLATAKEYISSGEYYWNSGMFMFRASTFLNELKILSPMIFSSCEKTAANIIYDGIFASLPEKEFTECPSDSIDYAVMEKTALGAMVALEADWSDIGSWQALWECSNKDHNSNVTIGNITTQNTKNSYINTENCEIAVIGIDDLIIVEVGNKILVANKNECQNIKNFIDKHKGDNQ